MRAAHPGVPVVTYVNSSADVKAESDVCCTSSNAVQVAEWAAAEWGTDRVIVIPDEYLARNVAAQTTLRVITWAGRCEVHERFSAGDIAGLRKAYPGAVVLAHPECPPEVLQAADFAGSTAALGDWVVQHAPAKVVLLTECSMSDNVAAMSPATEFVRPCNLCPHMKRITLENIYDALRLLQHEVEVPADRATRASCHRAHAGAARYGASARIRHRSTVGLGGTRRSSVTLDETDILVVGAGLAGLYLALELAPRRCIVLSPAPLGQAAASAWAQGGIAAAIGPADSPEQHAADTVAAGAGLVDPAVALLIAREAPRAIEALLALGVPFDRDAAGNLATSLEAAHSRARVARVAGDLAGRAIMRSLVKAARAAAHITLMEGVRAVALLESEGAVTGVLTRSAAGEGCIRARETVLATGGCGGLFRETTNPPEARGAALAQAFSVGAVISDPEFVQFHPTAIDIGADPAPLATEALRGEGSRLVDAAGEPFMLRHHPQGDLAPRDVVARAIHREREAGRGTFLDCRDSVGSLFPERFPAVFGACMAAGIDPRVAPIPVAPAAHYHMGGIVTDVWGRTTVPGLSAFGECASTGAHGANRLASNSLLESAVFAARIATRLREGDLPCRARARPSCRRVSRSARSMNCVPV